MIKTITAVILTLALIISVTACGMSTDGNGMADTEQSEETAQSSQETAQGSQEEPTSQKISAEAAFSLINSGESVQVIDVRRADEYEQEHIPGAILIPNEEIGDTQPELLPLLDTKLIVYCRTGVRSAEASAKLRALGYTDVNDMGGINSWPYEKESGAWTAPADKEKTLSSFYTNDLSGKVIDESIFAGHKLTMINIWATFCGPCLNEMPEIGLLAKEYADKGVQIAGIVTDVTDSQGNYSMDQIKTARTLVQETGADYLHLLPSADLIQAKLMQVYAVPETIFVDADGNIVGESYIGSRSGADWAAIIDELLQEVTGG